MVENNGVHPGGRPRKFQSVEELQKKINAYFESCWEEVWIKKEQKDKDGNVISTEWNPDLDRFGKVRKVQKRPYSITGLALALDTTRDLLVDYENRDDEFSDTIKHAKEKIHNFVEEQLLTRDKPTGIIFNLKNNYGWRDKTETELTGADGQPLGLEINVVYGKDPVGKGSD